MLSLCNAELEFFLKRHPLEFCFCFGRNFKIVWTNSRPFSLPSVLLSSLFLFTYSCEPKPSTIRKAKIFGKGRCEGGGPRTAAQNPPMDFFALYPASCLFFCMINLPRNAMPRLLMNTCASLGAIWMCRLAQLLGQKIK